MPVALAGWGVLTTLQSPPTAKLPDRAAGTMHYEDEGLKHSRSLYQCIVRTQDLHRLQSTAWEHGNPHDLLQKSHNVPVWEGARLTWQQPCH